MRIPLGSIILTKGSQLNLYYVKLEPYECRIAYCIQKCEDEKAELRNLYRDLKQYIKGISIKEEITEHVAKCLTYRKLN